MRSLPLVRSRLKVRLVSVQQSIPVSLRFGQDGRFECELDSSHVTVLRPGPRPCADLAALTRRALLSPLDFPRLDQAVVSDDRIVIVLDRRTPGADVIIAEIWKVLETRHVEATNVLILQPAVLGLIEDSDPRSLLPDKIRKQMIWKTHDPTAEDCCALLTASSTGETIQLDRELVDAAFVILVGMTAYDTVLGYRGTGSGIYPGLSSVEAIRKSIGQGHQELVPSDIRPLRQLIDEVTWLLGIQFTVQVVPADDGGVFDVFAGNLEAVFKKSKEQLDHNWMLSVPERVEMVVVAVPADASGHGWRQIGSAIEAARQLVESDGRIVVLSQLKEAPGEGILMLLGQDENDDCMQQLRAANPLDITPATQISAAANWARVYLLSKLDPGLVDDLCLFPLESTAEVERLLATTDSCILIGSAQYAYGVVD